MGSFVTEHEVLRWGVIAAFVVAGTIVVVRHMTVPAAQRDSSGTPAGYAGGWPEAGPGLRAHCRGGVTEHESDAAHLLMCLVMLAMLLFPMAATPDAIRGLLTAMVVVYTGLLVLRIPQWRSGSGEPIGAAAVVYHLVAAGAMLWVMAGHHHGMGQMRTPPVAPVMILAALFVLDAMLLSIPRTRTALQHSISHLSGPSGTLGVVPHVVMDLGTAYMLVGAVLG